MTRLKEKYQNEVVPKLREEFGIANILAVPKPIKIILNVGAGEARDNQALLGSIVKNVAALSGQQPIVTKAKKSVAGFKIARGQAIGVMVTLRGRRMYEFLDKLITVVLPKVRDFRGVSADSFDNQGNFTLGLKEQAIFPEVTFTEGSSTKGLEMTIVTTAKNKEQGRKLLELLGMPFKKG